MRRWAEPGARLAVVLGLLASTAWLVWRVGWSMTGAPLWLALPALAVELGGVGGAALLAWALWPRPEPAGQGGDGAVAPVDVVVRIGDQPDAALRATLVALGSVRGTAATVVVDIGARPHIARLAAEFGASYAAPEPDDLNGLTVACDTVTSPSFLLLDAGDVPAPDIVGQLGPWMADGRVAIAQGRSVAALGDSPEHGPTGVHELAFERESLNPALGRQGMAMWLGSGSLVRRDALAELTLGLEPSVEVQVLVSAALIRRHWRIVAPAGAPLVAVRSLDTSDQVHDDRVRRARAMRQLLVGSGGALRVGRPVLRQRAAVLAWSVRPLSGLRRGVFLAVLLGAIQAGQLPFTVAPWAIAGLWAPGFALTSLGLALASGWTLRPGDRTRTSMHTLGAAYRSLIERGPVPSARPMVLASGAGRDRIALVGTVIVVSVVMALRGVSEQFTHSLRALPHGSLTGLTAIGLWTLAMSLDALRLLARRDRIRRLPRLDSALPAELDGCPVSIADLTSLGAGIVASRRLDEQVGLHVGQRLTLRAALSTASGSTGVELDATVRNLRLAADGGWRIGLEFAGMSSAAANALAELCTVEPARQLLDGRTPTDTRAPAATLLVELPGADDGRRLLLRLTALLAVAGAVASAAPATVAAAGPPQRVLTGGITIEQVDGGPDDVVETASPPGPNLTPASLVTTVVAVCSLDAGADGSYGTADDVYGQPQTTSTDADGHFELVLDGEACWASVDPPDGYEPAGGTSVDPLVASLIERVPVVTVDVGMPSPTMTAVVRASGPSPEGPASDRDPAVHADVVPSFAVDPVGRWTPTRTTTAAPAASSTARVLPLPAPGDTAPRERHGESPIVVVTLLLAAALTISIALGTARPRRAALASAQSSPTSPSADLAIK